jgi:alpha-L-rhamnosidase
LLAAKDNLLGVWLNGAPATLPDKVYWGSVLASADTHGFFPVDRRQPGRDVRHLRRRDL